MGTTEAITLNGGVDKLVWRKFFLWGSHATPSRSSREDLADPSSGKLAVSACAAVNVKLLPVVGLVELGIVPSSRRSLSHQRRTYRAPTGLRRWQTLIPSLT
ncbi:hypothetical protein GEV33_005096 [Tenebrio molitor]|uniref:Uncharacterized protein n=1 Tax=Tenebrio molitor TaxID=7067 RepID=A0A8J6HN64_TENMO|nr:hypothetical protein GEV33_005096 [Tenebrio molitor]